MDAALPPARRNWWTPEQLAEHWQVSGDHVRKLIRLQRLRAKNFTTSSTPRYRISDSERRRFETG